ncbi:Methyltransferase FkbM [Paracoccaceae bacterium]
MAKSDPTSTPNQETASEDYIEDLPEPVEAERPAVPDVPGDEVTFVTPVVDPVAEDFAEVVSMLRNNLTKVLGSLRQGTINLEVAAKLISLGPDRVADVVFNDTLLKFHVPLAGDDHVQTELMRFKRIFDHDLLISLSRKIPIGGVMLDIGGYLGEHAVVYAKKFQAAHVHVFEPQGVLVPVIQRTLALNGIENATVHQKVVADGSARLALGRQRHFSLGETTFVARDDGEYQSISIDEMNLPQVDYVKIDFEGTKMMALRGMQQTLEKFKPVICTEFRGRDINEQVEFLGALGYRSEPLPQGHFLFVNGR